MNDIELQFTRSKNLNNPTLRRTLTNREPDEIDFLKTGDGRTVAYGSYRDESGAIIAFRQLDMEGEGDQAVEGVDAGAQRASKAVAEFFSPAAQAERREASERITGGVGEFTRQMGVGAFQGLQESAEFVNRALGVEAPIADLGRYFKERGVPGFGELDLPEPDGLAGEFGNLGGRVSGGGAPVMAGLKAIRGLSMATRLILSGAGGDALGLEANEAGLANLAQDLGELPPGALEEIRKAVAQGLATQQSDGDFERELRNRLNRFSEGLVLGPVFERIIGLFGTLRRTDINALDESLRTAAENEPENSVRQEIDSVREELGRLRDEVDLPEGGEPRPPAGASGAGELEGRQPNTARDQGRSAAPAVLATAPLGTDGGSSSDRPADSSDAVEVAGGGAVLRRMILEGFRREVPDVVEESGDRMARGMVPGPEEGHTFLDELGLAKQADGIDFNFENIHTGEDVKRAIDATSERIAPAIARAKRGTIRQEVTKQLAEQLDMVPEVLTRKTGELFNAEQMVAARMALAESAKRLDGLAKKALSADATPRDMLEFRRQMAMHAAIQMQVKGAQTEIARALAAFRIPVEGSELADRRIVHLLQEYGGEATARDMARKFLDLEGDAARNKFAFGGAWRRTKSALYEIWINGLLSSPLTHMRNVTGNSLFNVWGLAEHGIAGAFGSARAGVNVALGRGQTVDRITMMENVSRLYGTVKGIQDGFVLAAKALRTGEPLDPVGKVEAANHRAISAEAFGLTGPTGKAVDLMGAAIRLPGRFLMAEDEFFKAVATRAEQHALAYRRSFEAKTMGATDEEQLEIATSVLRSPDPEVQMSVEDAARYFTFTDEADGPISRAAQAFQRIPVIGRIILPFRRTPINIMTRFFERTPAALVMPSVLRDIRAGGIKRDLALARVTMGSSAIAMASSWAAEGLITGGGPRDPRRKRQLRETGWQPWSFKFDKRDGGLSESVLNTYKALGLVSESEDAIYVSYLGIEPVGNFLAIAADTTDALKWSDDFSKNQDLAMIAAGAVAEALKDRSFFEGIANAAEAVQFGPGAMNRYLSRLAGTMRPYSILTNKIGRIMDPTLRDTGVDPDEPFGLSQFYAIRNGWMESIPGLGTDLPPRRNLWGDEVRIGEGGWHEMFNPYYISPRKFAPVDRELVRIGSPIDMPPDRIAGVRLTPKEHSRLVEMQGRVVTDRRGRTQKQAMTDLILSDLYLQATDEEKVDLVRNVHRDFVDQAVREFAGVSRVRRGSETRIVVDFERALDKRLANRIQQAVDRKELTPTAQLPNF